MRQEFPQKGEFNVVAGVRLLMAFLRYELHSISVESNVHFILLRSIIGALSIVGSAVYRKTLCNPKVRIPMIQLKHFKET